MRSPCSCRLVSSRSVYVGRVCWLLANAADHEAKTIVSVSQYSTRLVDKTLEYKDGTPTRLVTGPIIDDTA